MCSEMQQNSLLVALVDDLEPGLPWPLTTVSSSPKTLWDQKQPVLPAPQRDTIDDVQAFYLLLGKRLRVGILGIQLTMSRKSFRGASTTVGAVIQVLKWMITANVARSRIPLISEAVI